MTEVDLAVRQQLNGLILRYATGIDTAIGRSSARASRRTVTLIMGSPVVGRVAMSCVCSWKPFTRSVGTRFTG